MERKNPLGRLRSSSPRGRRWTLAAVVLGAVAAAPAVAETPADRGSNSWLDVARRTQAEGTPAVLIVTSEAVPASRSAARSVLDARNDAPFAGGIGIAELLVEEDPDQAAKLQVRSFPTYIVYRRGEGNRLALVATYRGAMGPEGLAGWLHGIGILSSRPAPQDRDDEVGKAGFFPGHGQAPTASPQQYPYPEPTPQYPVLAPQPPAKFIPAPQPVREVYAPPRREVVREVVREREAPAPRRVVREIVVEREPEPAPREIVREVVREREAPAPRNLLSRGAAPREIVVEREPEPAPREVIVEREAPREVVREVVREREPEPAPREIIVEREAPREVVREVVREREAPREVVVERAAPREVVVERAAPVRARAAAAPELSLIQPGILDRVAGAFGERLRRRALPRVDVAVETNKTYRLAPPAATARMVAEPAYVVEEEEPIEARVIAAPSPCRHGCRRGCPHDHGQEYGPPPVPQQVHYPPPVYQYPVATPQAPYQPPVPHNAPSPQTP